MILSPHLDDAVIDCWSVLSSAQPVEVVNVYAGSPPPGYVAYWDRISGADDSALRIRERLEEDRRALARAGRRPTNLPLLSSSYRQGAPEPTFRKLDAMIVKSIAGASAVYAPAALGAMHPDHEFVRSYALALAGQGFPVTLYADLPYAVTYGWPHWVTGLPRDPYLDVNGYWAPSLATIPGLRPTDKATVVELSEDASSDKLLAMRTYASQFSMLDCGPIGVLSNPAIHRFEVFWSLATKVTASA